MKTINVIIETPKGNHFKYKYNSSTKYFEVHKALPEGLAFPYDFGFIPNTKGQDGDPLDVLIFSEYSFLQKAILPCKILGALKAEQSKEETKKQKMIRNDRIIVVPEIAGLVSPYKVFEDIPSEKIKEIENFFIYYNAIQDKIFKPLGILTAKETKEIIKQQLI
jgi:inorganic pyrophosphatase